MYSPQLSDYTQKADLDEAFRETLDSIRTSYRALTSQSLKIRVEKWCMKLVSTGSSTGNRVFAKHRNNYARLLLYMVQNKKFEEPFNTLPPEGPLPSFPSHQRMHITNESSLNRETSFWNDLKDDLNRNQGYNSSSSSSAVVDASMMSSTNGFTTSIANRTKRLSPRSLKSDNVGAYRNSVEKYGGDSIFKNDAMRTGDLQQMEAHVEVIEKQRSEIDRLVIQTREYETKIEHLEQLLREEKIKHDLAVQRLLHDHRLELAKLEDKVNKNNTASTAYEYETQRRNIYDASPLPSNQHESDSDGIEGYGNVVDVREVLKKNNMLHSSVSARSPTSTGPLIDANDAGNDDNDDNSDNIDEVRPSENMLSTQISGLLSEDKGSPNQNMSMSSTQISRLLSGSHSNRNMKKTKKTSRSKKEDDEFLEYIEKFQAEIQRTINLEEDE